MLLVAVAFALGVGAARLVWHPALHWGIAALLLLLSATFFARRRRNLGFFVALLSIAMAGGFALESNREAGLPAPDPRMIDVDCAVDGYVLRDGLMRPGLFGGQQQSVDIETETITAPQGTVFPIRSGARISIYTRHSDEDDTGATASFPLPVLRYGQRLRLIARLHPPRNYHNPGAWDYRGYLQSQGISLVGSAHATSVAVLPGRGGSRWKSWQSSVRNALGRRIQALWPEEQGALFEAMLIGARSDIGRDLKVEFQSTGTFHILVVSGMNVGILAFCMFWLFRKLPTGDVVATLLTLVLSAGYAWVTDLGAPIVRSVWTLAIYLITRLLFRESSALNAIGMAGLSILVWTPGALFDPSFQLTFLSVLTIAGIAVPWIDRTSAPYRSALRHVHVVRYDRSFAPRLVQFRLDLRMIGERLERLFGKRGATMAIVFPVRALLGIWDLALVSLLMEFALALPMAWYFHRLTLLSPIANGFVVPLTGVLMPSAVMALAISPFSLKLAALPAAVAGWSLRGITGAVTLLGHLRISSARVPTPEAWLGVFAVGSLALAIVLGRRRWVVAMIGTAAVVLAGAAILFVPPTPQLRPGVLEITAIDVGQGDSLFIATPEGKTILLDAGGAVGASESGFDVGEQVVSPYLWARGISRLDVVAWSHPHADHVAGMASVIRNFHPLELWYGFAPATRDVSRALQAAREERATLVRQVHGNEFDYGGAHVRVLLPLPKDETHLPAKDDDVMALKISVGRTSALLIGDAPKSRELQMVAWDPGADLLKIAHHGSLTSTTDQFLEAVQPRYGVISVGARNRFRHPRPEVLARLSAHRVKTCRTDVLGAATFYLDGTTTVFSPDLR